VGCQKVILTKGLVTYMVNDIIRFIGTPWKQDGFSYVIPITRKLVWKDMILAN
jgi:hypothetical protein